MKNVNHRVIKFLSNNEISAKIEQHVPPPKGVGSNSLLYKLGK